VRRIFSRIGADRPQSVAVIGGKKSGKTSLLACISDDDGKMRMLPEGERFLFARMGARGETFRDPGAFLAALLALLPACDGDRGNRYEAVRGRIDSLHAAGRRVIVFLDDFHFITTNPLFPLEFFSFLRSMANNYNLAYVTTSILELQKLCAVKDVQESPFFNIFTNLHLGMLSTEDARTLFLRLTSLGEVLADRVTGWCGGSPYLIKCAAARLLQERSPETLDVDGLEHILPPVVEPYFAQIVAPLPPSAYKPLLAVSKGKAPDPSNVHYLDPLIKQGFLVEEGEGISCFSPAFARFLRQGLGPGMLTGKG
jgi:hypothetical protein